MMKSVFKNYSEYQIRRLKSGERINSFNCGDDDLNNFILNESHLIRKLKKYFIFLLTRP